LAMLKLQFQLTAKVCQATKTTEAMF